MEKADATRSQRSKNAPESEGFVEASEADLERMLFDGSMHKTLLDNLGVGIYFVDSKRRISYWNKGAENITGYTSAEVLGKRCSDNILNHVDERGHDLCRGECPLTETIADGNPRSIEAYLHHKDGHRVPVFIRSFPITDAGGKIVGAVEVFDERSTRIAALERINELERIAYIDHLTGLANRRYTEINLQKRLDEMQRYGWPFGVIMIDIDHFKDVNDRYGHGVGDKALVMVAKTLVTSSRSFDLVGRWGGEEFVIIAPNVTKEQLQAIASRLCTLVRQSSLKKDGDNIRVSISAGATLARPSDTVDTLIKRADQLLYKSKQNGRNQASTDA